MHMHTIKELERLTTLTEAERRCITIKDTNSRDLMARGRKEGVLVSVAPGINARAEYWNFLSPAQKALHKMRSLAVLHPEWIFCSLSAALAYGLPISYECMRRTYVATPTNRPSSSSAIASRHRIDTPDYMRVEGLNVTPLAQTVVDCLRCLEFDRGLAVADAYLRVSGDTREGLLNLVEKHGAHKRGVGQARITAAWADGRAENGGESVARAHMLAAGFQVPELQVPFDDPIRKRQSYRVDFLFRRSDGTLIAGELDGKDKYGFGKDGRKDPAWALRQERFRESRLTALGLRVMRFSFEQARDDEYMERLMTTYGIERVCARRDLNARCLSNANPAGRKSRRTRTFIRWSSCHLSEFRG